VGIETYGRRAFSVAGPMARNSLPDFIRAPTSSTDCLGVYLKRTCSRVTSASSALAVLNDYALYKSTHSLTHCLETWIPTDTPPHSFASCPSAASPHFLSSRQLFNQWSERREGTCRRRSCSRRRRPRSSHGGGGGGGGGSKPPRRAQRRTAGRTDGRAVDSRRMINGKSRIEFASVKRVSDTYSVQRPLERRVQR